MGWSESYYTDMRAEAEQELRRLSIPLRESLEEFHKALTVYHDFTENADELDLLLQQLERLMAEHDPSS